MFGMTSGQNDKRSDGHLFGMTMILLYKYFIIKIYFAAINFQVFLKHPPSHMESILQIHTIAGCRRYKQVQVCTPVKNVCSI